MNSIIHAGIYPHPPIVVPEVGGGEEKKISATAAALEKLASRVKDSGADTLVIISPHGTVFRDAVSLLAEGELRGSLARFGAPSVDLRFTTDLEAVGAIGIEAGRQGIPTMPLDMKSAASFGVLPELDHGALVPLYFLDKAGVHLPIVHITFGLLTPGQLYKFGMAVTKALSSLNRRAAIVASGDLSHRLTLDAPAGFSPQGEKFDNRIVELIEAYDVPSILSLDQSLLDKAGECGYRSFLICFGMLDGYSISSEILSYEGPFGVGYLVADLSPHRELVNQPSAGESEHVRLARQTLETYVKTGKKIKLPADSPLTKQKAATFVSLKVDGQLRGCIGTLEPVRENIAGEIMENAISAGIHDPRFRPVTADELPTLTYSVDVLSEAEEVRGPADLDHRKYGVIVQSGHRRGVLLPDLEGVDTVEEQLSIALQKAGISPQEPYKIFRFLVQRYY